MSDIRKLKENFDVERYLEDMNIEYSPGGDNVSDGWVGVKCLFCPDHKNHLGICLDDSKRINCWICGMEGDIIEFIKEKEGVSFPVAKLRLEQYQTGLKIKKVESRRRREYESILPKNFLPIEPSGVPWLVKGYLERRGFPLDICKEYNLGWVRYGEYQMRLIVPVYLDYRLVSFQAIDVTRSARLPFLDCPEGRAVIPNKHTLYGIDDIGEQVIIVEGVTDKWRMGKDAVAMFTKNFTIQQMNLLRRKAKGKRVKVLLDADAVDVGERLGKQLAAVFDEVIFIALDEGDPANLPPERVKEIVDL